MKKRKLFYGIYALLIFLSGTAALGIQYSHTGSIFGELSTSLDKYQAISQLVVFGFAAVLSFVAYRSDKFSRMYAASLVLILIWFLVFEVALLGWRELIIPRIVGATILVVLPTAYLLAAVLREQKQKNSDSLGTS